MFEFWCQAETGGRVADRDHRRAAGAPGIDPRMGQAGPVHRSRPRPGARPRNQHWPALASMTRGAPSAGPAWPSSACFADRSARGGGRDRRRVADLAAALAQLTEALAPGPVLPTLLAAGCCRAASRAGAPRETAPRLGGGPGLGGRRAGPRVTAPGRPDGSSARRDAGPVLGGGTTAHLLLGSGGRHRPAAAHVRRDRDDGGALVPDPGRAPGRPRSRPGRRRTSPGRWPTSR